MDLSSRIPTRRRQLEPPCAGGQARRSRARLDPRRSRRNPQHLVVGAWVIGPPRMEESVISAGTVARRGLNQAEMRGQSVLALAGSHVRTRRYHGGWQRCKASFVPSDGGQRWKRISPEDSNGDPQRPVGCHRSKGPRNVIYAGTWHLPWKTTDAGEHWDNITSKQGIIDDSDVFSIIIDPISPQTLSMRAPVRESTRADNAGLNGSTRFVGIPNDRAADAPPAFPGS